MSRTILSTYDYVRQVIATRGDGVLHGREDPFLYNPLYGAYIEVRSADNHFLTWAYLEGVMVALYNALYLRGKFKTATFQIVETDFLIGTGRLRERQTAIPDVDEIGSDKNDIGADMERSEREMH